MKVLYSNICRGLINKISTIQTIMSEENIEVCALAEIDKYEKSEISLIDGYDILTP